MDPMTAIAASGLRARMESLDMLANNVANTSTGGYKADREFYSLYVAPEAQENDLPATMPLIERPWIDLSQGVVHSTGNALDVALNGPGILPGDGPDGTLYTRDGSFSTAANGTLVTAEGYAVQGTGGAAAGPSARAPGGDLRRRHGPAGRQHDWPARRNGFHQRGRPGQARP